MLPVSFVIPVKNDAVRLARCLSSIRVNADDATEIIVADNGSGDSSADVARQHGAVVIVRPDLRVSGLRNTAASKATGQLLAFVDADHELADGWLTGAREALREPSVAAAGALYEAPTPGTWVQRLFGALRGRTSGRHEVDWLGSGNLVVRRSAFEQVGGFDESLEACEDVDLCQRLRMARFTIVADERLRSVHHGDPRTLAALFRAERWRGRDNIRVTLRGGVGLRDLPSLLIPVVDLLAIGACGLGLVFVPVFGRSAALAAFAAALVPLGLASLRAVMLALRLSRPSVLDFAGAFAVALVYDIARAVALVSHAPHHRKT